MLNTQILNTTPLNQRRGVNPPASITGVDFRKLINFENLGFIISSENVDNGSEIELNSVNLPAIDGEALLSSNFRKKVLNFTGYVKSTNQSNLREKLENIKKTFFQKNAILDYAWPNSNRTVRYIVNLSNPDSFIEERQHWQNNKVDLSIEFEVYDGFGKSLSLSNLQFFNLSEGTTNYVILNGGVLTTPLGVGIIINSGTATKFEIKNNENNQKITIEEPLIAGDVLFIDEENLQIYLNNVLVDFEINGMFPLRLETFQNNIEIIATGTSLNFNLTFRWTDRF